MRFFLADFPYLRIWLAAGEPKQTIGGAAHSSNLSRRYPISWSEGVRANEKGRLGSGPIVDGRVKPGHHV
jgi:hypothetical protein